MPRPKPSKISRCPELRDYIQERLGKRWSPEQIIPHLHKDFPDRPEMHVFHETIYRALYVQGRGELRREVARALRTGRARRKPRRQAQQRQPRYADPMVLISDRPAEAEDRAVPGHWAGDLIIGKNSSSAIGTLVERTTRYVMLVHLPCDHGAVTMRDALLETVKNLPSHLRRSLTWDQAPSPASPGPRPCSNSPGNSRPHCSHACSESTSASPSNGREPQPHGVESVRRCAPCCRAELLQPASQARASA